MANIGIEASRRVIVRCWPIAVIGCRKNCRATQTIGTEFCDRFGLQFQGGDPYGECQDFCESSVFLIARCLPICNIAILPSTRTMAATSKRPIFSPVAQPIKSATLGVM
jgi:hypothetical protein